MGRAKGLLSLSLGASKRNEKKIVIEKEAFRINSCTNMLYGKPVTHDIFLPIYDFIYFLSHNLIEIMQNVSFISL